MSVGGMVCHWCGNGPSEGAPLEFDENGHLQHRYDDVADDSTCPPMRAGWRYCDSCDDARPYSHLYQAEIRETLDTTSGREVWTAQVKPPTSGLVPFFVRIPAGEQRPAKIVPGTKGLIREGAAICTWCRERADWPESARVEKWRPAKSAASAAPSDTAERSRLDAIPADGDGVTKAQLMKEWELGERQARDILAELVAAGRVRFEERTTGRGGKPPKVYWRIED